MGIYILLNTGIARALLDNFSYPLRTQSAAPNTEKYPGRRFAFHQLWTFVFHIVGDGFPRLAANWDNSCFTAFSGDSDKTFIKVHIFDAGITKFRQS